MLYETLATLAVSLLPLFNLAQLLSDPAGAKMTKHLKLMLIIGGKIACI